MALHPGGGRSGAGDPFPLHRVLADAPAGGFDRRGRAHRHLAGQGRLGSGAVVYDDYGHHPEEIKATLLQVRQQAREEKAAADAPKAAVTCPYCGATTTPDASGCCEYCGGAVTG